MTHKSPCLRGEVEVIVRLARRHMGMGGSLYYAPSIPVRKESNARRAHALHLPHQEPILVLYDDTLFGGAEDGFLITPERLCWKNIWEHPRQLTWSDIAPSTILAGGGQVHIAGGHVNVDCELTGGLTAFLVEMVTRRRSPGPYRDPGLVPEAAEVWASVDAALKGSRA